MNRLHVHVLALAAGLLLPAVLYAHPLAPSLLEFQEREDGQVRMLFKTSVMNPQAAILVPRLMPDCSGATPGWPDAPAAEQAAAERVDAAAMVRRFTLDCGEEGLLGRRIAVEGLGNIETSVLLRVTLADGSTARAILEGDDPPFTVSGTPTLWQTARDYLVLGFDHILGGFDHLLFVLGLLFLIAGQRTLLLTVTAFTVGHSITLSLASLDLVHLPSGPVELAIAASIWVVALELARKDVKKSTWAGKRPWLVAGAFGLLHGFGFAGALAEAGLPAGDIPLALLSFNVGIELGQLAFIAVVLTLRWILTKRLGARLEPVWFGRRLEVAAAYLIGTLATFWCLERGNELQLFF